MDECQETIKKVAEEGLEARNLINYISDGSLDVVKTAAKPPTSPRPHSVSPKPPTLNLSRDDAKVLKPKRKAESPRPKPRLRSASAGRNPEKDLRARYWTFLFENLHRAVDEIYQTCEVDESIIECKEAIMVLDNYSKDFHALIQYINVNQKYEKTASINRPTSLAWEIRKSSPGKSLLKNIFIERLTAGNSQAKRVLCFDGTSFPKNISEGESVSVGSNTTVLNSNCLDKSSKSDITSKVTSDDHNALIGKKECGITVSVVPEVNETFPCNNKLIINEICCVTDKILMEKSSVIAETEDEIVNLDCEDTSSMPSTDDNLADIVNQCDEEKLNESESVVCCVDKPNVTDSNNVVIDNQTEFKENKVTNIIVETGNDSNINLHDITNMNEKEVHDKTIIVKDSSNSDKVDPQNSTIMDQKVVQNKIIKEDSSVSNSSEKKKASLKRKVFVRKSPKVSSEKTSTLHNTQQIISSEEKNNSQNSPKLLTSTTSSKNIDRDKIVLRPVSKVSETVSVKKNDENINVTKNLSSSVTTKKNVAKPLAEKTVNATVNKQSTNKVLSVVRKVSPKADTPEEKKSAKTYSKTSAIQRNISYVSSLSSKNQLEKAVNEEKKKPLRTVSHAMKMPPKSGSMSSLHKISAVHRWSNNKASSVEQIPEVIKPNTDEDSDGWETVRGRNRCRNSPAKKIPFSTEKNDKALDLAKLNQSRFGGFPYTTKSNAKSVSSKATPKKIEKNTNKVSSKGENANSKSRVLSDQQVPASSAKKSSNNKSLPNNSTNSGSKPKCNENAPDKSKRASTSDMKSKNEQLIAELKLSEDITNKIKNNAFKSNKLIRSASCSLIFRDYSKNSYSLSKVKSLSEQSLHIKKYSKIQLFSRNSTEKSFSFIKKKTRKSGIETQTSLDDALNTSLDESDTGLTSDDQEGQTSHDEAFDAYCQDLCDTAWKYKILEQQVHKLELSWGEQMDRFDMELRTPGRALEMHEKLSSPFRKKSLMESIRLQEEKQVKAREQRERLLVEKLKKAKEIEKKLHCSNKTFLSNESVFKENERTVEERQEMRALLEQRQEKQRMIMEQKLQRAEEKRKKQIEMIVKKAHDEEEKVNEIAFINTLEAQNKRHDLISKEKDHEARLHDIQEERQRKQEEKAAKEAAAEERRKLLEAERQARLNEMQEKRKMRDHKVEQLLLVKEKERQELASQKARDREQRLSALNAQQQITIEELQKKIQLKQEESARRHEENMELIRQKAFELSVRRCSSNNDDAPQPLPYETKKICTLCNVLIGSEVYLLSHLRGKKHQETVKDQYHGKDPSVEELEVYNLKHIVDASTDQLDPNIALDKERQKALKKRCKKLRQRMSSRGQAYESQLEQSADTVNSNVKTKMSKITADIKKLIANSDKSSENNVLIALERCLNETEHLLEKKLYQDKVAFRVVGGLAALMDIFKLLSGFPVEKCSFLHKKIISHLKNTAELVVDNCHENCMYILFSNRIGCLLDLLIQRLNILIPNNCNQVIISTSKSPGLNIKVDITAGKLMHFLSTILTALALKHTQLNQDNADNFSQKENQSNEFQFRVQDVISYIVSIGIVDKLSQYFNSIQGPVSNEAEVATFLLDCIAFLTSLIKLYSDCFTSNSISKTDDSTQLIAAIKVTNMIGSISLLYGLLLHSGVSSRGDTPPPELPKQIESLVISTLQMLNNMAVMNLQAFQTILGSEGLSLQLRHITSHLLWYCNHWTADALLHEIILLVGYFTVLNVDNQSLIQAGQRPTVLQQLCSLPFLYFSDSELTDILFPTLIACCFNNSNNKTILEQEMSSELLYGYIEEKYLNNEDHAIKPKQVMPEKRWLFSTRFPKNCWSTAKQYFAVNQD